MFGVLHIPLPAFWSLNTLSRTTPRNRGPTSSSRRDPKSQARIWIRELEEETGAVTLAARSSAVDESTAGSSSGVRRRGPTADTTGPKYLPNFLETSYEEALRSAQSSARALCVVLVSSEHDDDAAFKRSTLSSPEFIQLLEDNDFLIWGGDVKQSDAYGASTKLSCTTYPFVAFVALQPSRGSRNGSSSTTMTVLSRHPGLNACSSDALCAHLTTKLVPRVLPFLSRFREERAEAERAKRARENALVHEREMRRMQEKAYADSARKDTERIKRKIEEEKRAKKEAAELQLQHEAFLQAEQEMRHNELRREEELLSWRHWAVQQSNAKDEGDVRIAVRLPNGERLMKKFQRLSTLTALYAFVDASILAQQPLPSTPAPATSLPLERQLQEVSSSYGETSLWPFTIINAYPRLEIPWKAGSTLGDVSCLAQGGQVVVEMKNTVKKSRTSSDSRGRPSIDSNGGSKKSDQDDDDEYLTESDEE